MGDHGAHFYRGSWYGDSKDMNVNMRARGVLPADVTLDLNGVLFAINKPYDSTFPKDVYAVNIFRYLFSALGDEKIMSTLQPNQSFAFGYITSEDGVILDNWTKVQK